jgi:predicted nucleic acid-binding Zn ribbon protein
VERADSGLEKLVANTLKRVPAGEGPLLAWPVACGSVVAEKTRAVKFENEVLQVEVPNTGWRKELQAIAPQYLAILNRYCGEKVKRIEFVIAGQR